MSRSSLVLDFRKLHSLSTPYIKEYFENPKKDVDVTNDQIKSISNIISDIIKNYAQDYMFQKIKDKTVKANKDGLQCLRKSKTPPVKASFGYDLYRDGTKIIILNKMYSDNVKDMEINYINSREVAMEASKLGYAPKISDMYTCCSPEYGCYSICYLDVPKNAISVREFSELPTTTEEMKNKIKNIIQEMIIKFKEKGILFESIWSVQPIVIKTGADFKVYFMDFSETVRTGNLEKKIYDNSLRRIRYLFDYSNNNDIQVDNYVIARMLQDKVLDIQF